MPREYQVKTNNPYHIDNTNIYRETLYIVKDYKDLLRRREQILYSSPAPPDGMPGGSGTSDPTFSKAAVLVTLESKIESIEQTISRMRGKYANTCTGEIFDAYGAFEDYGVFCYYRSRPDREIAPCIRTWKRYRSEFIWNVAKKLNFF